jgi:acyl-CoA synthetase (AMP-forming)/AMP-acid ligase II
VWLAVPRIWEKIKAGIEAKVAAEESPVKKALGRWALGAAARKAEARLAGRDLKPLGRIQAELADKVVLSRIREALGLDQLKWCWSGAASIAPETLTFYVGLGIEICEIWGMSESCGSGTLNPPGKAKVGTGGPPLPGTEVRLADDGELLIRGPGVMAGYRRDPEKTAEAIYDDGCRHTGHIGRLDENGYVTIVDRKKEIIINAAGKNMSPANIENTIKVTTPLAAAVAVVGDGRPYNVASPPGHATMRDLLEACVQVTGSAAELRWTSPAAILAAGIRPWTDLPIWVPPGAAYDAMHQADVAKASAAGLRCRPAAATVADTWSWLQALGDAPLPRQDRPSVGLSPEIEARVLGTV